MIYILLFLIAFIIIILYYCYTVFRYFSDIKIKQYDNGLTLSQPYIVIDTYKPFIFKKTYQYTNEYAQQFKANYLENGVLDIVNSLIDKKVLDVSLEQDRFNPRLTNITFTLIAYKKDEI